MGNQPQPIEPQPILVIVTGIAGPDGSIIIQFAIPSSSAKPQSWIVNVTFVTGIRPIA
jgi:hypothetical protein